MCRKWSSSYHPCDFPYTGTHCSETFAESAPSESYSTAIWLFRAWYIVLLSVSSQRMWYIALDHGLLKTAGIASKSPRRSAAITSYDVCNTLLFVMAFCLFLQSIDLYSWMDIMPYRLNVLLRQLCFACCCAVASVVVVQWVNLVYLCTHPLKRGKTRSRASRQIFWISQVGIWLPGILFAFLALYWGVDGEGTYSGLWGCADAIVFCTALTVLSIIALVYAARLTSYLATDEESPLRPNPVKHEEEEYAWRQARLVAKLVLCIFIATGAAIVAGVNECIVNGPSEVVYESPPCYYTASFFSSHPSAVLLPIILTFFLELVPGRRIEDSKRLALLAKRFGRSSSIHLERAESQESTRTNVRQNRFLWLLFGSESTRERSSRNLSRSRSEDPDAEREGSYDIGAASPTSSRRLQRDEKDYGIYVPPPKRPTSSRPPSSPKTRGREHAEKQPGSPTSSPSRAASHPAPPLSPGAADQVVIRFEHIDSFNI